MSRRRPTKPRLEDLFDHDFTPSTLVRAHEYVKQRRVRLLDMGRMESLGLLEIHGESTGSQGQHYRVDLGIDDSLDAPLIAQASCTCPVGEDCKHAAALMLLFAQTVIENATSDDPSPPPPPGDEVRVETLQWLDLIASDGETPLPAARSTSGRAPPCLLYLLDFSSATSLPRLHIVKSYPLKKGGMAKPTQLRSYAIGAELGGRREFACDADDTPLRLFMAMAEGTSSYGYQPDTQAELQGETGALLLRAAAATGRLYLKDDLTTPFTWGEPRPLPIAWQKHDGQQHLVIDLPRDVLMLPVKPPHYCDIRQRQIGALEHKLSERMFYAVILAPPLNEREALLVRAKLEAHSRQRGPSLPLPQVSDALATATPLRARLRLTTARFRHPVRFGLHEEYPAAELHFDYADGVSVAGDEFPEPVLEYTRDGAPVRLLRDLDAEQAVVEHLHAVGLVGQRHALPEYARIDSETGCLLTAPPDARQWLPLISDQLAHLESHGIEIEYADDFPFSLAEADEWFVAIAPQDKDDEAGSDWFDLDLGVMIGGERISLVPPLLSLLREQPGLLRRLGELGDEAHIPVRLDARRILPVPVPRLRSWLRPLLELLDDDRPRLSRYQAAALADLDEQPTRWLGGDGLRALGERLRSFAGMQSAPPAPGFNATLRPYQQAGLDWLQFLADYKLSGILADDMGLGKTVQTLAHLHREKHLGRADLPSLVIAPTSLLPNWAAEARQFTPELRVLTLHGPTRDRLFDDIAAADLVLSTYPLLVRDRDVLLKQKFHLLVLDEAQFIKNPKAQSHRVARRLDARHRLSLTGTPLENHLGELWAQFDFLLPGLLGSQRQFTERFRTPIEKLGDSEARARLAARVAPFMLRRTKEQVLQDLPPSTEIIRWVELAGGQRDLYESLRVAFDRKLRQALASQGVGRSQIMILDALLKLRQTCCDPRLVKLESAQKIGARGLAESAKLGELLELLDRLLEEGRRVLLFSQFTSMLGLIEDELRQRGHDYVKLTGQTRDRDTPVRRFQAGEVPIFMISLKAGGTGLNLTAADTVIHYDPWWNPAAEAQATARAHRIGQDKPVFVYKLLGRGTVEEKILALQERKRGLADQLIRAQHDGEGGHLITAADLDVLFEPLA